MRAVDFPDATFTFFPKIFGIGRNSYYLILSDAESYAKEEDEKALKRRKKKNNLNIYFSFYSKEISYQIIESLG